MEREGLVGGVGGLRVVGGGEGGRRVVGTEVAEGSVELG